MNKWKKSVFICMTALFTIGAAGCGVSHKSPEKVTESLIEYSVKGKENKVKNCYGEGKDAEKSLQSEIDAAIKYFDAHNVKELNIQDCDILSENKNYTYVYITYNLVLENGQEYPCIGTYMVGESDNKYNIIPPSKITEDMRSQAVADYAKFMTTDTYKNYTKAYDTFIKKNPGYEEKIADKLN